MDMDGNIEMKDESQVNGHSDNINGTYLLNNPNPNSNKPNFSTLPFIEKYRPSSLNDMVSHTEILQTLSKFIDKKNIPHLLLHGPPGTGKTSCIFAMAKTLYGDNKKNILELNASDDRGIDTVREKIKEFCSSQLLNLKGVKLVILDEADQMTTAAQMALRRVIEKYTRNVRFCLICNQVSRIIPPIQSRCMRFRFSSLKPEQCSERIRHICSSEGIEIDQQTIDTIIRIGKGDMRKILNILESTFLSTGKVTITSVYEATGLPNPQQINFMIQTMFKESYQNSFNDLNNFRSENGFALNDIILETLKRITDSGKVKGMLLIKALKVFSELDHMTSLGSSERILLSNLIGIFVLLRENGINSL